MPVTGGYGAGGGGMTPTQEAQLAALVAAPATNFGWQTQTITLAELQALGAVAGAHVFTGPVLTADQFVSWWIIENGASFASSGGTPGVYVDIGHSGNVNGLSAQFEVTTAARRDSNVDHMGDLAGYKALGDVGGAQDLAALWGQALTLQTQVTLIGAGVTYSNLTAGGPLKIHYLIGNVGG